MIFHMALDISCIPQPSDDCTVNVKTLGCGYCCIDVLTLNFSMSRSLENFHRILCILQLFVSLHKSILF